LKADPWLRAHGLRKSFSGVTALAGFSCSLAPGEILGLVGPNGAGKTTFFDVVTGIVAPDAGSLVFGDVDLLRLSPHRRSRLGIARTFQEVRVIGGLTAVENVVLHFHGQKGERVTEAIAPRRRYLAQEASLVAKGMELLERLGLTHKSSAPARDLSYGEQKRLSLACCLATEATVILLDEPLAGLTPAVIETVTGVLQLLREEHSSVILVEHDFSAASRLCDRLLFMDAGAVVAEGTPEEVRSDPRVIEVYLGSSFDHARD